MTGALRRDLGSLCGGALALALLLPALLTGCGGDGDKRSLAEKMGGDPEKEALEKAGFKANPKPRPTGLPPPTDAEFSAWDRKDPEGERHLHKFDKANLKKLLNYWGELDCFREKIKLEGEKAVGVEPGSPAGEQWHQFKQIFIPMVNAWQQRMLASEPRILEKSKLIGHFLEAHELVMNGYPGAFNDSDQVAIATADAHWTIVESKIIKYLKNVSSEELPKDDLTDPKVKEKHDKFCMAALNPPKNTGKAKVKHVGGGGSKSPKKLNMGDD